VGDHIQTGVSGVDVNGEQVGQFHEGFF
jgi:hypothetical protein